MSNGLWKCDDCGDIVEQSKAHHCPSVPPEPPTLSDEDYDDLITGGDAAIYRLANASTLDAAQLAEIRARYAAAKGYGEGAVIVALCDTVAALRAELAELRLVIDTDGSLAELPEAEQREAYRACALDGAHALDRSGAVVEEIERLRAECAAKDDEIKRRATEADTWFIRSRAHEQAADALRAECARLMAEREEITQACNTGMRLRLPAEQIVARIRAARAAAPTPGDEETSK